MQQITVKLSKIIALFIICFYFLIWILTPVASRFFSDDLLKTLSSHELVLSDESTIRYNPFMSHLSIYDLSLLKKLPSGKHKEVFSIKELQLEVGLYQLVVDKFHISEFEIDGLYIDVDIQNSLVEVAGITVVDPKVIPIEQKEVAKVNKGVSAIILKMQAFNLINSTIDVDFNGAKHKINLDNLAVEKVSANELNQEVTVHLEAKLNNAPFIADYYMSLQAGKGIINSEASLSSLELSAFSDFLPENISHLSGKLSYSNKQQVSISKDHIQVDVEHLSLALDDVNLTEQLFHVELGKQTLLGENIQIELNHDNVPIITGQATFGLRELGIYNRLINDENPAGIINKNEILAQLQSLELNGLALDINENQKGMTIDNITFKDAVFSDKISTEVAPLALFSQLAINQIIASETGVSVEGVALAGLAVNAQLDKNKVLSNLVTLPQANPTPNTMEATEPKEVKREAEEATVSENTAPAFTISLTEFSLDNDITINFLDESITPAYKRDFAINTLTVKNVDNTKPNEQTTFSVMGKSQEYAHFNLSGFVKPFAEKQVSHVEGYFKEMSLPAVSTYMKEALDYVFDSGQLDLAVNVTLDGEEIDGDMDILIRGVELTAAEDEDVGSMMDQTAIPFSVALGMLKDRDGNIELGLPLSGDTSSPSFGLSGFVALLVKQAALSAAQDYLLTTFVPYANVVSIALTAGDMLLTIRVNDLEYPPMDTQLQPEHQQFLAEFSQLLRDRDSESITLCAIATAADLGKPAGTKITEAADKERLKALSLERMHNFKKHMINNEKLASSRLLLCTPQIDSEQEAKPRLTFTN